MTKWHKSPGGQFPWETWTENAPHTAISVRVAAAYSTRWLYLQSVVPHPTQPRHLPPIFVILRGGGGWRVVGGRCFFSLSLLETVKTDPSSHAMLPWWNLLDTQQHLPRSIYHVARDLARAKNKQRRRPTRLVQRHRSVNLSDKTTNEFYF